jgi:hypothetical protein
VTIFSLSRKPESREAGFFPVQAERKPFPRKEGRALPLFCYRRYLPDKVINDFDFLKLLPVNLFHLTHQNPADKAV